MRLSRICRRVTVVIVLVLLAGCRAKEVSVAGGPRAPSSDIVLVTIDTWRADAAGFAGNARVKTPFLDRLASRGVVFTNAHAHNVVTLPSHANILTGLYPFQHGVRDNAGFVLDPSHKTIAEMLHEQGYATGAFIGAFPLDARYGLNHGFDLYDDNYGKGAASLDFVIQERPAPAVMASAEKWWKSVEGRKRFMWIHLYDPHAPYAPPEPFATQYRDAPYLGEVAAVDDALSRTLGPILDASKDATAIITGDHGEALGDHGEQTHGLFAYESTLKVPLLLIAPGVAAHREDAYVRHVDIVPTLLECAGAKPRQGLPGTSLFRPGDRDSYFESLSTNLNRGWAPLTGVIHDRQKFIGLPIEELYELPRDPGEKTNLRTERRRDAETAKKLLATLAPAGAPIPRSISAEEIARLRSLGYVGSAAPQQKSYGPGDDPKNLVVLDRQIHDVIDLYQNGRPEQALSLAQQVVAARPRMQAGRELLAFMYQQTGRTSESIAELQKMVAAGNPSEEVVLRLALLLSESRHAAEAVRLLAPLASAGNTAVLNAYGIALSDLGRAADAEAQFQRALQIDPNCAPALENLGIVALRRNDAARAQNYLSHALELNPNLPRSLNALGVVYAKSGDMKSAVRAWNRAVELDRRQYDALYNIGLAELDAGNRAEARNALERFVATAPRDRYGPDIAAARATLQRLGQ